jgi:hypothetical protein
LSRSKRFATADPALAVAGAPTASEAFEPTVGASASFIPSKENKGSFCGSGSTHERTLTGSEGELFARAVLVAWEPSAEDDCCPCEVLGILLAPPATDALASGASLGLDGMRAASVLLPRDAAWNEARISALEKDLTWPL